MAAQGTVPSTIMCTLSRAYIILCCVYFFHVTAFLKLGTKLTSLRTGEWNNSSYVIQPIVGSTPVDGPRPADPLVLRPARWQLPLFEKFDLLQEINILIVHPLDVHQ